MHIYFVSLIGDTRRSIKVEEQRSSSDRYARFHASCPSNTRHYSPVSCFVSRRLACRFFFAVPYQYLSLDLLMLDYLLSITQALYEHLFDAPSIPFMSAFSWYRLLVLVPDTLHGNYIQKTVSYVQVILEEPTTTHCRSFFVRRSLYCGCFRSIVRLRLTRLAHSWKIHVRFPWSF